MGASSILVAMGARYLAVEGAPAFTNAAGPVAIVACCATGFPQTNPTVSDVRLTGEELKYIDDTLAVNVREEAVVLFRFHPDNSFHAEPVYNIETAWPDDARIIRAHDLGPERNREIFRYYAERQPTRVFYLYDRATLDFVRLGTAREMAQAAGE
jgi:hypothetical protein